MWDQWGKAAPYKLIVKTWPDTAKCEECNVVSTFQIGPLLMIL